MLLVGRSGFITELLQFIKAWLNNDKNMIVFSTELLLGVMHDRPATIINNKYYDFIFHKWWKAISSALLLLLSYMEKRKTIQK